MSINDACDELCKHYCKYNDLIDHAPSDEVYNALQDSFCAHCPLNALK